MTYIANHAEQRAAEDYKRNYELMITQRDAEIADLRDNLQIARGSRDELRTQNQALMTENVALRNRVAEADQIVRAGEAERKALAAQVAECQVKSGMWEHSYEEALKDVSYMEADIKELKARVAALSAKLSDSQSDVATLLTTVEEQRQYIERLKAQVEKLQTDMMALHESADREIHGLYDELMSAKNLLAFIDEVAPASVAQVFEPGLTFTEACRRRMIVVWENAEAERQDE